MPTKNPIRVRNGQLAHVLYGSLPLLALALPVAAQAQTASNSASVTVPSIVTDPDPANNSVTDTDTVLAALVATNDTATGISAATGGTNVLNVFTNDTVNTATATAANADLSLATGSTLPTGVTFDTATGNVSVAAGTTPGTYTFNYNLCEEGSSTNCETATVSLTVAAVIVPTAETGTGTSGTASTVIANVRSNDTVNGVAADATNSTISQSGTWPTGITLNTTTGAVDITGSVAPGTYSITYELCDTNTPVNCQTVEDTVTVNADIAPTDDTGTATSGTASTAITNVRANDTVNGSAADETNSTISQSGTWPTGITLNTTTGAVTVDETVAPGTYPVTYELCDLNSPVNCETATTTITIAADIVPVADTGTGTSGTASTVIANVRSNDTVNGVAADATNSTISQSGTWPTGITLNTTTGAVDITGSVAPGTYSITYELCDTNTPVNCQTVEDTVTVNADIAPTDDTGTATSGTASTAITNVRANDTVNGSAADETNSTISQSGTWPTGITLNTTTGAVTVDETVAPGTYPVTYELCDLNSPVNCETATTTITIAADIVPVADTGTGTSGTASTVIANVRSNDTVNGVAADATNSTISQSGTWPTGITLNTTTGAVDITGSVAPGTYSITYELCDTNTPVNCQTVEDTVTVNADIAPTDDTGTATSGTASTAITNVRANDTVNGSAADETNSTISQSGTWPTGITLNTTTGAVTVDETVAPGTYPVTYELCDLNSPVNCETATTTITIAADIVPVADTGTGTSGTASTVIANVRSNDTVNGVAADATNSTISQSGTWPTGITLNTTTGAVDITGSVAPGTYSITYELCDTNTPVNCQTVEDTVTVNADIAPTDDTGTATSGTASTAITNVRANDTVNGSAADETNSTISQSGTWPTGITLNTTTGAVTVDETVAPGTYPVTYELCDLNSPVNCETATTTITIAADIVPVADTGTGTSGTASTVIANVRSNDTVNGVAADATNSTISQSGTWPTGITLNTTTGAVDITGSVAPGTYSITYELCDTNTPVNCQTVEDTVTVNADIAPTDDTGTATSGTASTAITNVRANDTVNGSAADETNSTISQSGTWPTGITLNTTTGAVTVDETVAPGTYPVTYELCDLNSPVNCETATTTITIAADIVPVADTGTGKTGTPSTVIANVRANDTVNGSPADATNSTISQSGTWPTGITLNTTTGAVSIDETVAPGTYPITYELCDTNTPANCQTVEDTVTVNNRQADIQLAKSNGVNEVTTGETISYTLTISNAGPDSVTGVVVNDSPGSGLSCPATGGLTFGGAAGAIPSGTFTMNDLTSTGVTLGTLENGESVTVTYSCTVN